ncbi:uncharacterized protein BJ171DRAFT_18641 [Polychytrium aggregatum]|uniref:uncharacterized protein n=1 Tax=Polychytrium aggregatum TaxID=110093 RepID=UPI0022FEBC52|nr:uncharacterized protein BJ171DRAFT_18641 [Polychytrium aggregatum]KAI9206774.1 hypothetical protein BJ171DRAFT_18641 [Polychytrium aggregatum]
MDVPTITTHDEIKSDVGTSAADDELNQQLKSKGPMTNDEITQHFKSVLMTQTKFFYENLRNDCVRIEEAMKESEREVLRKEEEAYLIQRHDAEMAHLKGLQQNEFAQKKEAFQRFISARDARKKAKRLQRQTIRDMKRRDRTIMEQETASREAARVKSTLTAKRNQFDALTAFLENKHEKQRRQLASAQERKIQYERVLDEMQNSHERVEVRRTMQKKFMVRMNHQNAADKRIADQLQEIQQLELKHAKEKFDLEYQSYEDVQTLKAQHFSQIAELGIQQTLELHSEKERLLLIKEQTKLSSLEAQHASEIKKLSYLHRQQVRALRAQQDTRLRAIKGAKAGGNRISRSVAQSQSASCTASVSDMGADDRSDAGSDVMSVASGVPRGDDSRAVALNEEAEEDEDLDDEQQNSAADRQAASIKRLTQKHRESRASMLEVQKSELEKLESDIAERTKELEEDQAAEMREMLEAHESEMSALYSLQEKEIQMEASVHDAESKMMVERRVLNSVLDTVINGIINIDPTGIITRFNNAAEAMFGYKAAEVIGKNIKMLQPEEIASIHDQFLINYLTTGIKKIIGYGRRAFGKKKDGSLFPVHISVSEVRDDGAHLFTGIVRDLTEEVAIEEQRRSADLQKKKEIEDLIHEVDRSKAKSDSLLSQMLPPAIQKQLVAGKQIIPESYDSCTLLFSNIVGYSDICAQSTPLEMVELLNGLYTTFDEVISQHDAYKVETINDSYVVASGLPNRNGQLHTSEIADLALDLLSAALSFKLPSRPDFKLKVQIGVNTGPIAAGVVGLKMPRYCLFGDTINVASRMMSSGEPMKIQISEPCYLALNRAGGYYLISRGETKVKGKGLMNTYWLAGKENLTKPLPVETTTLLENRREAEGAAPPE